MNPPIIPPRAEKHMPQVFAAYPELTEVILFGSRATGAADERSDIDLAVRGFTDHYRLGRLILDLEDLPVVQKWDVKSYEEIKY
ncbi:MAG: nucleotidyltransferase domain-containing protein, partial [Betaproteobacteria bacterium]|nr:nucleotidyltransferase domain-containing protein [Betaproteobacteria bacterium]